MAKRKNVSKKVRFEVLTSARSWSAWKTEMADLGSEVDA